MTRRLPLALLALLALAASPLAGAQAYRATGTADVEVDGASRRYVAFEVSDGDSAATTATWDTGAWIGDWWLLDLVFIEADTTQPGWDAGGVPMLSLRFFVDPDTGLPVADVLRTSNALLTENSAAFWPFHESFPGQVEVTIDAVEVTGDVMRVLGSVTAVLGLVADMDADEPDPDATITLHAAFDLTEVARIVD